MSIIDGPYIGPSPLSKHLSRFYVQSLGRKILRKLEVAEKMQQSFSLIQTVATAGVFSAVACWYGFMFGRESARKELGGLIEELRRGGSSSDSPPHS